MAALWRHSASILVLLVLSWPCSRALSSQHLCGPHLVEALNMVCGDRGFFTSSRRDLNSVLRLLPSKTEEATLTGGMNDIVGYAFNKQMDMMVKRDGIVEQCCHQPCSMIVLDKYCN
ncbi:insulin-like [Dunckerocampus dactyliophorus]|uniref:insulin-like n=1 Tax=Dunckerocampus dactyliophorus TaxID=161453 RepID=UPI002404D049|nr:insulin-like [Dunckerocampus dactyliophorus]